MPKSTGPASTFQDPDAVIQAQYDSLRRQVPIMYLLILTSAVFLGLATSSDSPFLLSVGVPTLLVAAMIVRAAVWISRPSFDVSASQIRRYLRGTTIAAIVLSAAFGAWSVILLHESAPTRIANVAVFVSVGAIGCCYCLQALPNAARAVLVCGAMPVTASLLVSGDWSLIGIALNFVLVAILILKTISRNRAAGLEVLHSRAEMATMLRALQKSDEHYRHSVELNPQIPWLSDATGALTELSTRWTALTGVELNDALGWGWTGCVHPDDLPAALISWREALNTGNLLDMRYRLRNSDGGYRWYRARATPRKDGSGKAESWYGTLEDIHDQVHGEQALRDSEERFRLATRATNDLIFEWSHRDGRLTWADDHESIFGHPFGHQSSKAWWVGLIHPDDRTEFTNTLSRLKNGEQDSWHHEYRFLAPNGQYLDLVSRGYVIKDDHGMPVRSIGAILDITAFKRVEEDLRWAAYHDPLTLLPNRKMFAERLEAALTSARTEESCVGVIVLDVDGFKLINDSEGHSAGDHLLTTIGTRISANLPEGATLARLGGDEFALILPRLTAEDACAQTIQRVLERVDDPITIDERTLAISVSAGAAMWPQDGKTAEDVLKSADLALYAAKSEGGGVARGFKQIMRATIESQTVMLREAREALEDDRVVPFYQPKVELATGKVIGFEALLRWHHDRRGLQPPSAIAAAFADWTLSTKLTDRMIDYVLADLRRMQDAGADVGRIAINASTADFRKGDFAERLLGKAERADIRPSQLEIEVTENVFLGHAASNVEEALFTLAHEGVTIALDDFGTGYASLTHLRQFPVHVLKIDRSFITPLDSLPETDSAIVHGLIDIAKRLNIRTVAEGVETEQQLVHLRNLGCGAGQGYLFCRPMSAERLPDWLNKWTLEKHSALGRPSNKTGIKPPGSNKI